MLAVPPPGGNVENIDKYYHPKIFQNPPPGGDVENIDNPNISESTTRPDIVSQKHFTIQYLDRILTIMAIMFNFQEFAKILLSLNISGRLSGREDGSSFCFNCLIGICLISIVFRSWCFNGHNGVTFFNIICFCCQSYIFLQFA